MCKFYDEQEPIITDSELDMSKNIWRKNKAEMITVKCGHCDKEMIMYLSLYKTRATNNKIFCSRDCYNASGYRKEQIKNHNYSKKGKQIDNKIPIGWKYVPKCSFEEAQERLKKKIEAKELNNEDKDGGFNE